MSKKAENIDLDALLEAIKEVKINGKSIRSVASQYNIPKSNLSRYISNLTANNVDFATADANDIKNMIAPMVTYGPKTYFTAEQEMELMKYVLFASNIHYGLSIVELKTLAYQYAKKIGIEYPAEWDTNGHAGKHWYYLFMKRHPNLSLRKPQQVSANRSKAFNKENVDGFYKNLSDVLAANEYEPHRIWNMDECGMPTVPTKAVKQIAEKGQKQVATTTSAERGTNVSLALAANAYGNTVPAFFIFPKAYMREIYLTHAGHGATGDANGSGYMTSDTFVKWMKHFIVHSGAKKGSPTLLLLDNFTAHLSIEAIDLALAHDITMVSFPPHCTHKLQPLDATVFGPLKTALAKQHDAWQKSNIGVKFDIHHIPQIADICLDIAATPRNIKAGFASCGIYPFNPDNFSESDFVAANPTDEMPSTSIEQNDFERRIVVLSADDIEPGAHEEVATSESSFATSSTSSSAITPAVLRQALNAVGPLNLGTPAKKSNRGRKPMKAAILTSPEVVADLREKADAKRKKIEQQKEKGTKKGPPAKKNKPSARPTRQAKRAARPTRDVEFCILCFDDMPERMTAQNTAKCIECQREVHLRCVYASPNTFKCPNCESDGE
ncbi:uncharacterized protein LOC129572878 [Sitodiplosis mosellana]|uniref:uncharacterized protein LOC129572878 n=1 Tax=Sitodiplosis mosellana TaxID=263140 RepID=UPI0024443648|nr:uncharacterized protein LOC129572878 [Sitodiplosis mosellana]